jgi:hypothetical protein
MIILGIVYAYTILSSKQHNPRNDSSEYKNIEFPWGGGVFPLGVAFAKQMDIDEVIELSSEATASWASNHR